MIAQTFAQQMSITFDVDLADADVGEAGRAAPARTATAVPLAFPTHTSGTVVLVDVGGGLPPAQPTHSTDSTIGAVHATTPPTATFFKKSRGRHPVFFVHR